jgi:cell division protein FtsB
MSGRTVSRWGRRVGLALMLGLGLSAAAQAQSTEDRVRELERQVEALRAEVAALQQEAKGGGEEKDGDGRLTEIERKLEVLAQEIERLRTGEAAAEAIESRYGFGPAASKIYRTGSGLSIGGYGELLYESFDSELDSGAASNRTDQLDVLRAVVYFGYKWNDRWLLNTEIEYEHGSTGEGGEVAVEFAYVDYLWKPEIGLRAGLLLVPMGFLNELHEPTVFLGARRPQVETAILPTTWRESGFGIFGNLGPVSYRTYVLNGLDASGFNAGGLRGGRQKGARAKAEDFAWVGRLDYTPLPGLVLGGSAYLGDSGQDLKTPGGERIAVGTRLLEGHLEWRWRGLELRALGVRAELDDVAALNAALRLTGAASVGEELTGSYVQLGYDLLAGRGGERALTPYARWETVDTQAEVPAGFRSNPANDADIVTLGIAFKPIEQLIVKVDHQNVDNGAGTGLDQLNVLLGYIF